MDQLFRSSVLFLTVSLYASLTECKNCETLDGKWYNQLGSEIYLKHDNDGTLLGEYRTAQERFNGSAGDGHSIILGTASYDSPGAAFAFSVVWRNGSSTTVWTGQCIICEEGHETLLTSWLLRSKVDTCIDKWKSTQIGRDTFTRHEQLDGPRKQNETNPAGPPTGIDIVKDLGSPVPRETCDLNGNWYNALGSEMILSHLEDDVIRGEYRTAVEREKGAAGNSHSKVYGIGTYSNAGSTFAFFVVWRNGASVTGWVGQCHVCGENKTEILESTWLLRSKIDQCVDNWQSTLYSEDSFTRTEQKAGPRKKDNTHTPDRSGEGQKVTTTCRGAQSLVSAGLFVLIIIANLSYYC